ncbi:MAG TPA: MarR family transcriptional regulator [Candidatus Polarisedimenticolia bacterium]|nr:MarR family transcriptional regulator [Candidatus Polarisedimenticolia bacterium]
MPGNLTKQAEELDGLLTDLIKRYRSRDRSTICCDGVTVAQCYALKALGRHGSPTMSRLAKALRLSLSAATRVVDQLETKGYALRCRTGPDGRVCCVELTASGRSLLSRMQGMICASEREVLSRMTASERERLLAALRGFNAALDAPAKHR